MNENGNRLIVAAAQQQAQAQAILEAEIRATAREIYSGLAKDYIARAVWSELGDHKAVPTAKAFRELADLAWKSAQYVYVPAGIVKVDDEKTWGKA